MNELEKTDQIAADLVSTCYAKQGALAAVIRLDGEQLRILAPADRCEALALMLYRAADAMAEHAAAPSRTD